MDIARVLRDLWRRRAVVGVVVLVALFAAIAVTYRVGFPGKLESRKYQVGVATTRILVDTPNSQVVDVSPKGSDTLGVRANLIGSLMVDGVFKAAIARRAGLRPDQLVGIAESDVESQSVKPPSKPGVNVLTTRVLADIEGSQLPIIEISAQASDAAGAARLANAAVTGLADYLDSQAAVEQVPNARRLRVSGLGAAQASEVTRGPSIVVAFGVAIFIIITGCALVLAGAKLVRAWRTTTLEEGWPPLEPIETPAKDRPGDPGSDAVATLARPYLARPSGTGAKRSRPITDAEAPARSA